MVTPPPTIYVNSQNKNAMTGTWHALPNAVAPEHVEYRAVGPVDKATLWDALKEELEHRATHHDLEMIESGVDRGKIAKTQDSLDAQAMLDRMLQAETLAIR